MTIFNLVLKQVSPRRAVIANLLGGFLLTWHVGTQAQMPTPAADPVMAPHVMPPPMLPGMSVIGRPVPALPMFQKIGPGMFALGDAKINKTTRTLSLPAVVNMNKGMLEYLLVRNGGKTHESLLRTQLEPMHLHMAMLLMDAEGTDHPLSRQGDTDIPQGNPVEIKVYYMKDGSLVPIAPEAWVTKKVEDQMADAGPLNWVFTGSFTQNGRFMAQNEGSVVAIYRDPAALFNNASSGGENDRVWFVKEGAAPPVGTPVTVTITIK